MWAEIREAFDCVESVARSDRCRSSGACRSVVDKHARMPSIIIFFTTRAVDSAESTICI